MSKKLIEFVHETAAKGEESSPWVTVAKSTYKDLILKPKYSERRFKFPIGDTWCRIVPALKSSKYGWMLGVHALNYPDGRHAHPRTLEPGCKSAFDHAYEWCKEHQPDQLYNKNNKDGARLLAAPLCLFWMITEIDGQLVARLIQLSGYDGARGGNPGLGFRILNSAERNEAGELICDPADPFSGPQICITKQQTAGSSYPNYSLRLGREPKPIDELIAQMAPEEREAIVPLEDVVQIPPLITEWELLNNALATETVAKIRDAVSD